MMETRTYRAPSLREAMRLAHRDMGTTAMVIHSGPVHVPHQRRAVAFDVVATGEPTLPATEATTGVGTLPLEGRMRPPLRKPWRQPSPAAPLRQKKSPAKGASIHRLKPLSTASGRLSERLETLRSRFDFFVRSQELAIAESHPPHLRLVTERSPVDATTPPWGREEATSVVLVGPRGADKSFVALEMACAGVAAGRDTVLVHIALERDPAMENLLKRARLKGVEAHAIHSSDDLRTLQLLLGEVDLMIVDAPTHNPFSAEEIETVAGWHNAGLEPLLVMQPTAKPDVLSRIVANHAQRGVSAVTTARASLAKEDSPLSRAAEGAGIPVFIVPPADAARQILPRPPREGAN